MFGILETPARPDAAVERLARTAREAIAWPDSTGRELQSG
jgi:hypothetical protein